MTISSRAACAPTPLADEPAITEKRMFGGLAFLVHGKMCVAASHDGGLLVRIDPGDAQALLRRRHAAPMEMNGRKMNGWIRVRPEGLGSKRDAEELGSSTGSPLRSHTEDVPDAPVPAADLAVRVGVEALALGSGFEAHEVGGPVGRAAVHELVLLPPAFVTEQVRGTAIRPGLQREADT